jgi:hypothetical protein
MTAVSSSRWAGTVVRGNDDQYRLARMALAADIVNLKAATATLTARIAAPTLDVAPPVTPPGKRRARRTRGVVAGYRSQAERYAKQQRLQHLSGRLARAEADWAAGVVHVVAGGRRLLKTRHNLDAAGLTLSQWQAEWVAAREVFEANGSTDEPDGNLTVTITPTGAVSLRLPRPLEYLANAQRGRYQLDGRVVFAYRRADRAARIEAGAVASAFTRVQGGTAGT